jgi:diguanylate cyclase (GGDEF)-like protein/PAS domain S-box-containing protein
MFSTKDFALKTLELTIDAIPVAVSWANSADGKILYMNHSFTKLFGYGLSDIQTVPEWFDVYTDDEQKELALQRWRAFQESQDSEEIHASEMEVEVRCKDGSIKTVLHAAVLIVKLGLAVATFVDITKRKHGELLEQARAHKDRVANQIEHEMLLDHSREMIVVSPMDRSERYVSPGVLQLTGFTPEEYLAQEPIDRVHPDDWVTYLEMISKAHRGETFQLRRYRTLLKVGGYRWIEAQVRASFDPETKMVLGYVANLRDVTLQKEQEEAMEAEKTILAALAGTDFLTGLANRRTFDHALTAEAVRKRRSALSTALILVDIDYYKNYNDQFGHLEGDVCLKKIAHALQTLVLRSNDVVARFWGDEFVILLPLTDLQGAETIAKDLIFAVEKLAIPHPGTPNPLVTVSVGVACCPDSMPAIQNQLLLHADEALYAAKKQGRNGYRVSLCEKISDG